MRIAAAIMMVMLLASPAVARRSGPKNASPNESAIVWNNRGVDLYAAGRYREAISAYDHALKMNPNYTDAYSNRGVAYDAMDQPDRAVLDYSQAIKLSPRSISSYTNRALAYGDLARFQDAINDWNVILKRAPRDANAYYRRGSCYQSMGNLQAALEDYERAVKLSPRLAKAVKSRDLVRKVLSSDGVKPVVEPVAVEPVKPVRVEPVKIVKETVRPAEQAAPVVPELPVRPAGATVGPAGYCVGVFHHVVGNLCFALGQYDVAATNFTNAINVNPQDHFAYYRRGNVFLKSGNSLRAAEDFDAAAKLHPTFKQAAAKRDQVLQGTHL